jgi:ABC-type sugar transport system ATPase subunit
LEIYYQPCNAFVAGFIGEPPMNFIDCLLVREDGDLFIRCPSFRFKLDDRISAQFRAYSNGPNLRLGVRPEDVRVCSAAATESFGLEVDFVQPQGERTIISLRLKGGDVLMAEIQGDLRPKVGETMHLQFDQRHIHFFDVRSGLNIFSEELMKA